MLQKQFGYAKTTAIHETIERTTEHLLTFSF